MTSAVGAPQKKGNRGLKATVIAAAIVLLAALVALALVMTGILHIPGLSQAKGEIVLQGADEQGRDAFSTVALATPAAKTTPATQAKPVTAGAAAAAAPVSGGSVGLYGGTGDNSRCDPAQLVSFLGSDNAKAQAFVTALNADPDLRWKNNDLLTTADIPAYVAQLTPLVLLSDTLVTNHGFNGSQATPFEAVLEAGTAVLVDRFGVPRARCICGNPLIQPKALPVDPVIVGDPWPGFDINITVVIVQVEVTINVFEVVSYPDGGGLISVPAGLCADPGDPASCASPWTAVSSNPPVVTPAPTDTPAATGSPAPTVTPTPTASAAPVDPNSVPQTDPVTTVCSVTTGSRPDQLLTVTNNSNIPIDVFWIESDCTPHFSNRLLPGESSDGFGYEGDAYVITSGDSTPLREFTLQAGGTTIVYP